MNIVAFFILILLAGCADLPTRSQIDTRLIGTWICESATIGGKPLPSDTVKSLSLTVTKTRYVTVKGKETLFDSTYRVDRSNTPARIFMLGNEGDLAGKEAQGIYELSRDRLNICYSMPGDPAPTTFSSAVGSKAYLVVWRRVTE